MYVEVLVFDKDTVLKLGCLRNQTQECLHWTVLQILVQSLTSIPRSVQNSAQKRRRRNPNQPPAQPTPQPTPQRARGGTSNNARGGLSPQPPARPPRAAPPARAPIAAMETAPFPEIEPQGHVFRSPIVFCDATSRQRVPACVYLVSTETPELGYFVVYILGREFCRIPLAQTNNTTTSSEGGEHDVMIMFKCDGRILSYLLTFQSQELQAAFIKTERGLRSRTVSSTQGQRATSAAIPPPSVEPTSRDDGTTLIYGSGSVSMSIIISEGEGSIPMDSEASVSRAIPAPVTPTTVGGLINLDAEEEDQAAAAESATELLATLGPVVYEGAENEADDQEPQPVVEPTEMIRIQYRLIQRVFRQAGVNELRAEEAIRDAFALYLPRIFPAMDQSQLERLAAEVIDSEARERFTRRTSYLPSEIFDLREHAVDPPAWLGDLDYLPKRRSGQRAQEAEPISPFQGRYDTAGIARSAAGYNWAMGLVVQAVPETFTAITGAGTLPRNTIGLRGSQCANGPIRSEDAAERRTISSPQVPSATPVIPATPVAAPMAALAAKPTEPHPASARSSRPSANVIQNTTAADEIENLSVNLARLSIGNPGRTDLKQESPGTTSELALTSAAPVQTAALRFVAAEVAVAAPISAQKTPVRARGLAASRHAM